MPCHVDPILPSTAKKEIDMVVEVIDGKIKFKEVGRYEKYPTIANCIDRFKKAIAKKKDPFTTFQWKVHGTMIVFVSPCPAGC